MRADELAMELLANAFQMNALLLCGTCPNCSGVMQLCVCFGEQLQFAFKVRF
jgi:hypothetical protein